MRIANQLGRDYKDEMEVRMFLMADAATCALTGQETPDGYYNIERMLKLSVAKGAEIKICGGKVGILHLTRQSFRFTKTHFICNLITMG